MKWMKEYFELYTRSQLQGKYPLLIIDSHTSHMSTEFITFTQKHKIICLCLPSHSTNLLQPLDVSVFGALKQNYKGSYPKKPVFQPKISTKPISFP